LIIPKRHVEKLWKITNEEEREIFQFLKYFQKKITDKLSVGCEIRQNYRPFLKQSAVKVNHIHFHLLPREFEDEIYQKLSSMKEMYFKASQTARRQKPTDYFLRNSST
jgi:diadenosine tetraphosphate (Ap4A) HIT family hydrolase